MPPIKIAKPPRPSHRHHPPDNARGPALWGSCGPWALPPRPCGAAKAIHRNRFERSPSDLAWAKASPVPGGPCRFCSFSFCNGKELKACHAKCCFPASTKKQLARLRILNKFPPEERKVTCMVARPEQKQWPVPHLQWSPFQIHRSPRPWDSGSEEAIPWAPSCERSSSRLASAAFARSPSHEKSSLEDVRHLSHHSDAWIRNWPCDWWTHLVLSAPSWSAGFLMLHHRWPHHRSPCSAPPCSGQLPTPFLQCTTLCRCSSRGSQPNLSEG